MLSALIIFLERIGNHLEMFFIAQKIGIARIDKQRFDIVLFDVVRISLLDIKEVFVLDLLLVRPVAFF